MKLRVAALQAGAGVPGGLHKEYWVWTDSVLVTPLSMQDHTCMHTKLLQSLPTLCEPMNLRPARFLCTWESPGKNTGAGCQFPLQGTFPTKGSSPRLLQPPHWQAGSLPPAPLGFLDGSACRILVPWLQIQPAPPALEAPSLNHWTAREVPCTDDFVGFFSSLWF